MNLNCPCGGRFHRSDVVYDSTSWRKYGKHMWRDTSPLTATWKCRKCAAVRTQRKRQPKLKPVDKRPLSNQPIW